MSHAAATRRRLDSRRRRAVQIAHRKRRDSHRGWPDLHQTHAFEKGATPLDAVTHFPDRGRPITWKFRVDRTSSSVTGTVAILGDQSEVGFDNGDLIVRFAGETFVGTFIGAPVDDAEVVVAFHPNLGGIRAWVDSELAIAGEHTSPPVLWSTSGDVSIDSIAGAAVRSDLDAFDGAIPRHFFEVDMGVGPIPTADDLLFRATRQGTDLATSRFPFMEKPD